MTSAHPSLRVAPSAKVPMTQVEANRLKRYAAIASISVATTLIVAKLVAWFMTGSVSLLSTMVDSILDLAASLVGYIAVRQAAQPADREHRFGHGKAEPLAGLAQAAFVAGSAAFLSFEAVMHLINPHPLENTHFGIGVMVLSIVLTLALVLFQRWVVRETGSVVIAADSLHYRGDLLINTSVIIAIVGAEQFGWLFLDPIFALVIAAILVHGCWQILVSSLDHLMDRELPEAERERIRQIALTRTGVIDIHDLRTRSSGSRAFIQFHLELDGRLTLFEAHEIADSVMESVEAAFPDAEVLIHEDPHGVNERRLEVD